MNIKAMLVTFICGLTISTAVIADDHVSGEQRPVEIWTCSFNDGKSMKDLDAWYEDFNAFADSMTNSRVSSFVWVPNFVGDLEQADVVLTFGFPSLTAMGQTMDEFFGSKGGSALFATYQNILDCSAREIWQVSQRRSVN